MPIIQKRKIDGWNLELDCSEQIISLSIPEEDWDYSGDAQTLHPTLPELNGFVPAAALFLKAKQFDDGLYAAVELAAQHGADRFLGKKDWLRGLMDRLSASASADESMLTLFAAAELGAAGIKAPPSLASAVQTTIETFLRDEVASKPIGFYTWTEELTQIFRQDRMLQKELPAKAGLLDMAEALAKNPDLRDGYAALLKLSARLTNTFLRLDLRDLLEDPDRFRIPDRKWSVFPPSRSHESELVKKMYGDRPVPPQFDLLKELITRIRSGDIALAPTDHSGWYDHQIWSLEPLIIPERQTEASRLKIDLRYSDHLRELFKGAFALARETHVKQLEIAFMGGCGLRRELYLTPELSLEPVAECYRRRAESYRFIRSVLEEALGTECLDRLYRIGPEGAQPATLNAELRFIESLFQGAFETVCMELGLMPSAFPVASGSCAVNDNAVTFQHWARRLEDDPDLAKDARMMVPVFYDRDRMQTKVWAFLGWKETPLDISYAKDPRLLSCQWAATPPPAPEPTDRLYQLRKKFGRLPPPPEIPPTPNVHFTSERRQLYAPVVAEVYVDKLLNRDEFRRHCDSHRTREEILANLK